MENFSEMILKKITERKEKKIKCLEEILLSFFTLELEHYRESCEEIKFPYNVGLAKIIDLDMFCDIKYLIEAGKNVGLKLDNIDNYKLAISIISTDEETPAKKIWENHQEQWKNYVCVANSQAEEYCKKIRKKIKEDNFTTVDKGRYMQIEFKLELENNSAYLLKLIKHKLKQRYLNVLTIKSEECICTIRKQKEV